MSVVTMVDEMPLVECDICAFPYGAVHHRPVMLPCGHSLCESCFQLVKDSSTMHGNPLACSTCRTLLPANFVPKTNYKLVESIEERNHLLAEFAKMQADNAELRKQIETKQEIPFREVCENAMEDVENMFINAKDEFDSIEKVMNEVKNIFKAFRTMNRASMDLRQKVNKEAKHMVDTIDNNLSSIRKVTQELQSSRAMLESLANDSVRSELNSIRATVETAEATKNFSKEKHEEKRVPRLETAFIVGLPRKTTENEVSKLLSGLGAKVAQDSYGKHKITPYKNDGVCYGYMVTFVDEATAKRMVARLNGVNLPGSNVRLRVSHGLFKERSGVQPNSLSASLADLSLPLPVPNIRTKSRMGSGASQNDDSERKVFVSGLPLNTRYDQIVANFDKKNISENAAGDLKIDMFKNKDGEFMGKCLITYVSESAANSIISTMNKTTLPGSAQFLTVTKHIAKAKTVFDVDEVNKKVFVDGLPKQVRIYELATYFGKLGAIAQDDTGNYKIDTFTTKDSPDQKCVITYEDVTTAKTVIELLNQRIFPGSTKPMKISKYNRKPHNAPNGGVPFQGGGRVGQGFGANRN